MKKAKGKRGGRRCVAVGPDGKPFQNTSYTTKGITMHNFPVNELVRQKWTKFVQRHRPYFDLPPKGKAVSLCSDHFHSSCFTHPKINVEGIKMNRVLIRGSVPTQDKAEETIESERDKRKVK